MTEREPLPCQNEDVSGPVIDLWFGDGWGKRNALLAQEHAARICQTVCAKQNPGEYKACREYGLKNKPSHGVWGGLIADKGELG